MSISIANQDKDALRRDDRRADVRLASEAAVEAVVIDERGQPRIVLEEPVVLNVSANGLAIATRSRVDVGERLRLRCDALTACAASEVVFEAEALEAVSWREGRQKVRCRLVDGEVPAQLIHGW